MNSGSSRNNSSGGRPPLPKDPRRRPGTSGTVKRPDTVTIVLIFVAAALLAAIVILMNARPKTPAETPGTYQPPVVERVETPTPVPQQPDEPIDLGVPQPVVPNPNPADDSSPAPDENQADNPASDSARPENPPAETTARIFFIKVSGEGKISVKGVLKNVPASASPLSTAPAGLLSGPGPEELNNNILSLIPEGSRLLGARIEGGTAFLDFNEGFRFNDLGIEGYRAQVEQIVYTATEFSTVQNVQILIEGQRIDYLGGEGFWVGSPLSRDDFRRNLP